VHLDPDMIDDAADEVAAAAHDESVFNLERELGRQARQNVRVSVQLPIRVRMAGRDSEGRTRDLSATGLGFSTRIPVELDQRGEVTVEFSDWRFRKAFIVRFIKPILAGTTVGVQFDELTQDERERLVKQVFDLQRAQLQGTGRR
jgi:c-di-GMP-binding flagellar brake protein YcgR